MDASMPVDLNDAVVEPTWSLQPYEAKALVKTLDKIMRGKKLKSKEHGEFFNGLKARLAVTCKRQKNPGAEHACSAAIDRLRGRVQRRKNSKPNYVDSELINALRRVLEKATNVNVGGFEQIMTPKFTIEATKALSDLPDMKEILAENAIRDMAADTDSKIGWVLTPGGQHVLTAQASISHRPAYCSRR